MRRGQCDYMLAGGFDSMINPIGISGFCLLGALSTDNDNPTGASRPFDKSRNGFVLGEGAGFLVLEDWDKAVARGATIYAELAGDGNSLSCYRITDSPPDGNGPIQAIEQALGDAGLDAGDIDYVNAHGTSTQMNDRSECAALKHVFEGRVDEVKVSSTKSCMGHLIAAAGAVEAAVCCLAIRDSLSPLNANYGEPDPDCDVNLVLDKPSPGRIRAALSNSLGFGGSNSSLVFRNPEEVNS
jgi:3-oxoacyl-(acyl-carrier-protein) synthase